MQLNQCMLRIQARIERSKHTNSVTCRLFKSFSVFPSTRFPRIFIKLISQTDHVAFDNHFSLLLLGLLMSSKRTREAHISRLMGERMNSPPHQTVNSWFLLRISLRTNYVRTEQFKLQRVYCMHIDEVMQMGDKTG